MGGLWRISGRYVIDYYQEFHSHQCTLLFELIHPALFDCAIISFMYNYILITVGRLFHSKHFVYSTGCFPAIQVPSSTLVLGGEWYIKPFYCIAGYVGYRGSASKFIDIRLALLEARLIYVYHKRCRNFIVSSTYSFLNSHIRALCSVLVSFAKPTSVLLVCILIWHMKWSRFAYQNYIPFQKFVSEHVVSNVSAIWGVCSWHGGK